MEPTVQNQGSQTTGLQPSDMDDDEISLLDLLQVVADNLRLLVLGPLAVGLAALGISFAIPPSFTAKTQILPPQQQQSSAAALVQSLGALSGLAGAAAGIKNPADQYVAFFKSNAVVDAMIDRFKLIERYEAKTRTDARLTLTQRTQVKSGKDGIIVLEYEDEDPAFAAQVANAYIEELEHLMGRLALTEAQNRRQFFERMLKGTADRLAAADKALRETGVSAGMLKTNPVAAVEAVARMRAAITAQELKVANMRGVLADTSPDMRQALTELSNLRAQLTKVERDEPADAGNSNYLTRFREFKYQETLYELFARQYELARVDEAREGAVIQVIDAATPPERKTKPKKALIAVVATLAAGMALLLFVFVRSAVRNAGSDPEQAEKLSRLRTSFRRAMGRS